jgi:hypothetical protein
MHEWVSFDFFVGVSGFLLMLNKVFVFPVILSTDGRTFCIRTYSISRMRAERETTYYFLLFTAQLTRSVTATVIQLF